MPERPGWLARLLRRWRAQRAARPWLDHLVHAAGVYADRRADLLAAGITYFGFLAIFPIALLALSVAGFVLAGRPDLLLDLTGVIRRAVPGDVGDQLVVGVVNARDSRGTFGLIGLVGLLYAGVRWMTNLRVAIQTIWRGRAAEPAFFRDFRRNLLGLIGLGAAVIGSVALTALATGLTDLVIDVVGLTDIPGVARATSVLGITIVLAGDVLIFCWLFVNLPREQVPYRAVLRGALFAAVGFELLKLVATFYLRLIAISPAAVAFGSAIGLVVWIYLVTRFLLFAAAWTATSSPVLSRRPPEAAPAHPVPISAPTSGPPAGRPPAGPSTAAVVTGLVGIGAVVGAAAASVLRRRSGTRSRH